MVVAIFQLNLDDFIIILSFYTKDDSDEKLVYTLTNNIWHHILFVLIKNSAYELHMISFNYQIYWKSQEESMSFFNWNYFKRRVWFCSTVQKMSVAK